YSGQGIRVAVIDGGFEGLTAALSAGELAHVVFTRDYTGDGLETGGVHGTACAEIVHDMAPAADLLLMKIDSTVDLANAVSDAIYQGADVITHSMGWFNTNFYDGTGVIAQIVTQAVNSGILWVNSAGNSATGGHWEGAWQDTDGDGWLDFAPGDEENTLYLEGGQTIGLLFTWDAWPATDQDYDLYLVDEWGNVVAGSGSYQNGTQEPTERIFYMAPVAGNYGIKVEAYDAPAHPRMELFCLYYGSPLEYDAAVSTITAPANAPFVLTVGAIDWHNWETGPQESFSSQGPTNSSQYAASIIKPDICGADAVSGMSYGSSFKGTSASSPQVAGAAALVWSRYPHWGATDVRDWLESNAVDMGAWGKDNIYGYGRLFLPPSNDPVGKSHTYGAAAGWYMVSVPLNSGSPSSLFGTTAYTYNPAAGVYDVASTVEPAKGYWVYISANKAVTDTGDQVTSDVTIDISTAGWWQVSAPWNYPKDAIQVMKGVETKSWADAAAAGWVRGDIYGYKASDGDYNMPSTLDPWYGYWVKAEVSGLSLTLLSALGTPVSTAYASMTAPLAAPPLAFAPADIPPMPPSRNVIRLPAVPHSIPQEAVEAIRIQIFDLSGRLVYEHEEDGSRMEWHTENNYGEYLANGVYLYKLYMRVNGVWVATEVNKLVILR
ncbi:MAG: S8 family serine peptidase, partial [Dehalococcoidia bacterium]|nr:S8 family serine peptidase [Dehalococcoidia bacterium]